jgi:hypothetical protein
MLGEELGRGEGDVQHPITHWPCLCDPFVWFFVKK